MLLFVLLVVLLLIYALAEFYSASDESANLKTEPQFKKQGELTFKREDGTLIKTIDIEVADDEFKTAQGLMYRSTMEEHQGMLFIFPDEAPRGFWMRNTRLSLDIMYVAANRRIVSIAEKTIPYSENTIPSEYPAQYVVEVLAGFSEKYSIAPGDMIEFTLTK
jgi:uncharacterized membrane protein (UPF0127 family)